MPGLLRRLYFVRLLPRRSGDAALIAAMCVCGAEEADVIAAELMERDGARASAALIGAVVRAWRRLSDAAREAVVVSAGDRLEGIVEGLIASGDASSERTAAAIEAWRATHGTADAKTIQRLGKLGATAAPGVGETARRALGRLTEQDETLKDPERAALDSAVALVAAAALEHGDSGFMGQVARMAQQPGPALAAWLDARGEAGHGMVRAAARKVLARAADPVGIACSWLRYTALARPSAVFIEELFDSGRGDAVLMRVDAMSDAASSAALRRWCRAEKLTPTGEMLGGWSVEARARVAQWLDVIGLREDRRAAALEMMLLDMAAAVRMSAVLSLARLKASPRVDEALFKAARDEDERVAVAAIEVLGSAQSARRRGVIAPLLSELAKHDGAVREAAAGVLSRFANEDSAAAPEVRVRAQMGSVRR